MYRFRRKPPPAQSDRIDPRKCQRFPGRFDIRRYIFPNQGSPSDETMGSDFYKLMNGGQATQLHEWFQMDMAREIHTIRQHTVVLQYTIVSDMHISHQEATIPYAGRSTCLGAFIEGTVFPDGHVVTYDQPGIFTAIFQILWDSSQYSSREYLAISSYFHPIHNGYVRANPGSFTDFYITCNSRKRINFDVTSQFSSRMDKGIIIHDHVVLLFSILAVKSPSETNSFPT